MTEDQKVLKDLNLQRLKGVNFNEFDDPNEMNDEKKKYFTAKYGLHQMSLIRKRLSVENWMIENLSKLYGSDEELDEIDLDLDEILDIESEAKKREFLMKKITKKDKKEAVEAFIKSLLEKVRTL